MSSIVDFSSSSDWIDVASTFSFENSGQFDFDTSSEYPNFSHISSATCGANGDNIATLDE